MDAQPPNECEEPCPASNPCQECEEYWNRMVMEGLWEEGEGWTDEALREWMKVYKT